MAAGIRAPRLSVNPYSFLSTLTGEQIPSFEIWVGTLNGLNKFRKMDNGQWKIEQMTVAHGFPSNAISMVKTHEDDV